MPWPTSSAKTGRRNKVSLLESKETIDAAILDQVVQVLKVPAQAIRNFDEEAAVNVISNTFTSNDNSTLNAVNPNCTFNPLDKVVELYERLLASEREKIEILQRAKG